MHNFNQVVPMNEGHGGYDWLGAVLHFTLGRCRAQSSCWCSTTVPCRAVIGLRTQHKHRVHTTRWTRSKQTDGLERHCLCSLWSEWQRCVILVCLVSFLAFFYKLFDRSLKKIKCKNAIPTAWSLSPLGESLQKTQFQGGDQWPRVPDQSLGPEEPPVFILKIKFSSFKSRSENNSDVSLFETRRCVTSIGSAVKRDDHVCFSLLCVLRWSKHNRLW